MVKKKDDTLSGGSISQAIERYKRESGRDTREILDLKARLQKADIQQDIQENIIGGTGYTRQEVSRAHKTSSLIQQRKESITYDIASATHSRYSMLQEQLASSVTRHVDPRATRAEIGGRSQDYSIRQQALSTAHEYSQGQLSRRMAKASSALSRVSDRMAGIASSDVVTDENTAQLEKLEQTRSGLIGKQALYKSALATQRRIGLSDEDVLTRAQKTIAATSGQITGTSIREQVAGNTAGSYSEVSKQREDLQKGLAESHKKAIESIDKTSEEYDSLIQKIKEHEKKLTTVNETMSEMERQGKNVSKAWSTMKIAGAAVGDIGRTGLSVAGGMRGVLVGSELMKKDVQTGYAGLMSDQYFDTTSALKGDPAALMRMMAKTRVNAQTFGTGLKGAESGILATEQYSTLAANVGEGFVKGASTMMTPGDPRINTAKAIFGGVTDLASASSQFASQQAYRNAGQAGLTDIQAQQKAIQLDTVIQGPQAAQLGAYQKQYQVYGEGLRGIGGGYEGTAREMLKNMESLGVDSGLTGDMQSQMLGDIRQGLGSKAGAKAAYGTGQSEALFALQRGGELYKSGVMESPSQYTSMLKQVSDVGGDTRSLENALKTAFLYSLDSSKNLQQLVSGIASVASNTSARLGIDTSAGAMKDMAGILSRGQELGLDPNLRAQMAASAADFMNRATQSGGANSIGGSFRLSELMKAGLQTPGELSAASQIQVGDIDAVIAEAESGNEKRAQAGLQTLGGGVFSKRAMKDGKVNIDFLKARAREATAGFFMDTGALYGKDGANLIKKVATGQKLTKEEEVQLNIEGFAGSGGGQGMLGTFATGREKDGLSGGPLAGGKAKPGSVAYTSAMMGQGLPATVTAREAQAGQSLLSSEKFNTTMEGLTDFLSTTAKTVDLTSMAEAPAKAAQDMATASQDFAAGLSTFNDSIKRAADALMKAANVMSGNSGGYSPLPSGLTAELNKNQSLKDPYKSYIGNR